MALIKVKPTSPGRRGLVKVVNPTLHKGRPFEALIEARSAAPAATTTATSPCGTRAAATSSTTASSISPQQGRHRAKVERLEYDPNRSAHLALLLYADGERRYIVAPRGVRGGSQLMSGLEAPIKPGNCLPLRNIPVGTTVHCVEMMPARAAQIARSAGASVQLLAREGALRAAAHALRRDPQGARRLPRHHRLGGQRENTPALDRQGRRARAGAASGRRCAAIVMNPVDHPHGGRTRGNRHRSRRGGRRPRVITPARTSAPTA
jgi:large subunit ribosomal protein L2